MKIIKSLQESITIFIYICQYYNNTFQKEINIICKEKFD